MTKDHEIILGMIEKVSPDDSEKLDEIDALVTFYIGADNALYEYLKGDQKEFLRLYKIFSLGKKYTRSRDALKSIRPKGWAMDMTVYSTGEDCDVQMHKIKIDGCFGREEHSVSSCNYKPEELAELHAIIQAIAYEREQNDKK